MKDSKTNSVKYNWISFYSYLPILEDKLQQFFRNYKTEEAVIFISQCKVSNT